MIVSIGVFIAEIAYTLHYFSLLHSQVKLTERNEFTASL